MPNKTREILEADIRFISLCPRGKNGFATLFKAETAMAHFEGLSKAQGDIMEKGELLAVVWAPNIADSDGDFSSPEAVEQIAHSYMKNAAKVDLIHDCEALPKDAAYVTESFIIQADDERFAQWPGYDGEPADVTGGWAVKMQIDDPTLRAAYRDGEWNGVSMYGPAKVRTNAAKAEKIKTVLAEKNEHLMQALRDWFANNGELQSVDISAFIGFDREQLMVHITQHLTTDMNFGAEPAMVMAAKFADQVQETIMNEEQLAAIAKAVEEATAPLNAEIVALKAAAKTEEVETPVVEKEAVEAPVVEEEVVEAPVVEAPVIEAPVVEEVVEAAEETEEEEIEEVEVEELVLADASDEDLLAHAAEMEIDALKAETDFADADAVRNFVTARKAIEAKAYGDDGKKKPKKAKRKPLRRNVVSKDATVAGRDEEIAKARAGGKTLAAYINAKNGYGN